MTEKKITKIAVIALLFALIALGSGTGVIQSVTADHANLSNLDYAHANHTGFLANPVTTNLNMNDRNILNVSNLNHSVILTLSSENSKLTIGNITGSIFQYTNNYKWSYLPVTDTYYHYTDVNFLGHNIINAKLNDSVDKDLANYTNSREWVNNSTMAQDNTKLNITGGNISGIIHINDSFGYTGAQRMIFKLGRTTTAPRFSIAQNDANGAINYRVNVNDDNTQQDISMSGFALAFQPLQARFALVNCRAGTTICTNMFDMYGNGTASMPLGSINLGFSSNSSLYPVTIYNLSGSGNRPICADPNGKLVIC